MISHCCSKKCFEKFDEENQKEIFENFWLTANYNKQNYLLYGLMKRNSNEKNEKQYTKWKYEIRILGEAKSVCQKFFLKIFQISEKRIRNLQNKIINGESLDDRRGFNEKEKINKLVWDTLKIHIEKIPKVTSHYSAEKSQRLYFENPEITMTFLYKSFIELLDDKISYRRFSEHFNSNYNIGFSLPKSDICNFCYESNIFGIRNLECDKLNDYNLHLENVQKHKELKHKILA